MTAFQQASERVDLAEVPTEPLIPPRRSNRVDELEEQIDRLRARMRIAVIYGGDKSVEGAVIHRTLNPRSWRSYQAVAEDIAESLNRLGFRHVILVPDDMRLGEVLLREGIHLAWLNTGGVQGYNPMSHAPAMLEMLGIPYIGHDSLIAGTLDNKHVFKQELMYLGVPTAPFVTWHPARGSFRPKVNSRFLQTFKDHWGPYIVKPVSGRASLHVHFVEEEAELPDAVAKVYRATENHVLIEAYLPGREFCVAVGGLVVAKARKLVRLSEPFVFAGVERRLAPGEKIFTSMDVRPITSERVRLLDPDADAAALEQLHELARKVCIEMNLESLIRLDLRADAEGKLHVLEANPKPDLKKPTEQATSLVCAALPDLGMDYDDLILSMLGDRLDLLFSQRRGTVTHLTALLE
ncbi:MAG: D-alanyl-alanine synthetase [Kiloniellaceae bacterium]